MTVAKSKKPTTTREPTSPLEALLAALRVKLAEIVDPTWEPFAKYVDDPVGFAREVLGIKRLWAKQIEILEAARAHKRITVRSGHKVSKSFSAAILALWFYCTRDDARVLMTSVTARQVERVLWRELRKVIAKSPSAIPGKVYEQAASGVKSHDFREIMGFTATDMEAVAGVSGANLLYIVDEASGVEDVIFEAIEGNRAGGARVILFSQPTRNEGEFFDSHNKKAEFYFPISISSEESPNVVEGRDVIPGLATKEWVEEKKREWGEESALYKVRVKGEFALAEDGKILSIHDIALAEKRWDETPGDVGELSIGVDPAGPGGAGDDSTFAPVRGLKLLELIARKGLTEDGHVVMVVGLIKQHRRRQGEVARVVVDRDGPIGAKVFGAMIIYLQNPQREVDFHLVGVRSGERANRQPKIYQLTRDELWASVVEWFKAGGAIPEHTKLAKELHAPEWIGQISGRIKCTPKDELRKVLGRSPDHADALVLAVWQADNFIARMAAQEQANAAPAESRVPAMNPYGEIRGGGGGFDPYKRI